MGRFDYYNYIFYSIEYIFNLLTYKYNEKYN